MDSVRVRTVSKKYNQLQPMQIRSQPFFRKCTCNSQIAVSDDNNSIAIHQDKHVQYQLMFQLYLAIVLFIFYCTLLTLAFSIYFPSTRWHCMWLCAIVRVKRAMAPIANVPRLRQSKHHHTQHSTTLVHPLLPLLTYTPVHCTQIWQ